MEVWSEGMVDLLADNLDGTGGLRAIDPRTVMSHRRQRGTDDATPDLQEMLGVAGATGARYAFVGSAVLDAWSGAPDDHPLVVRAREGLRALP